MRVHDFFESKIKGADGKACWKGYRYNGTKDGKDSCVKVDEARADVNFDAEDLKRLERISDLETLKTQAFGLISKPSAKPMKPEKVAWFKQALAGKSNKIAVIKMMYDLMLSGEGNSVIGSKNSMNPNSYRKVFNSATMESAESLSIGDDVIITGNVEFNGKTGVIDSFGKDKRFVVVNLYNHGRHSFHSSDVSVNDYAGSDEEQSRMSEAYQNDESNLWYIYDKTDGRLKQKMIDNLDEPRARSMGYRDSIDGALRVVGIIRSKFDAKKFVQKQGTQWVQVYPFGQQGVAETTGDEKFDKMLKGIAGKKAVAKQQKTDTKQQARDAFGGMFGGGNPADKLSIRKKGVAEGIPDVDHMPGAVIRNADMATDNVKLNNKKDWDRAVNSINARVFDDMSDFRSDSNGERVTGNSAVWAVWDNAKNVGWFNAKGRPLKPWPMKEQGVAEGLVGDVVVHNYTKIPIQLKPGQAQIAGWGPNDEPLYRVKGQDGKEVTTWSKRRMLAIAKGQGVAEGVNYTDELRDKMQWLMTTHHMRSGEAEEAAYYDQDPATWKGSPWEDEYTGVAEGSDNPYGYRKGQTVKLDNGQQGRVIDIFDDNIEVLLVGGRTVTVDFRDARVIGEQGMAEAELNPRLQKYLDNNPDEVSDSIDTLRDRANAEGGRFKWAIGKLPDGRFVLGLQGNIKMLGLQMVDQGISEAKTLHKRVKIVKGRDAGKYGWIREIKHGAYKGATKTYYVDIDGGGQANNLPASALRIAKEQNVAESGKSMSPGDMTPNWAKYVLDQIYNSDGAVTLTDLFDEGIPGLYDMFMATAQKHGFDPEEDFEDVQHELTVELEDLIKGGYDMEEAFASPPPFKDMISSIYQPKVGDKIRTRKGGQIPGTVEKVAEVNGIDYCWFRHPEGKLYKTPCSNVMRG